RSGLVSAAIAIVGSALFFLDHPASPGYQTSDLIQLAMLALTAGATVAITGLLRQRLMDSFEHERAEHATTQRLAAALDEVDIGIVLLDADTRAEFINRAFRTYFFWPARCEGGQQARLRRADVSWPRYRRVRAAGGRIECLHRQTHGDDADRRLHADQHLPQGRHRAPF